MIYKQKQHNTQKFNFIKLSFFLLKIGIHFMENFPRKCIKCKQADLPLKEFVYARSIGVESFKTVYIKVPVCEACEKDLLKYQKYMIYLNLKNIPF